MRSILGVAAAAFVLAPPAAAQNAATDISAEEPGDPARVLPAGYVKPAID